MDVHLLDRVQTVVKVRTFFVDDVHGPNLVAVVLSLAVALSVGEIDYDSVEGVDHEFFKKFTLSILGMMISRVSIFEPSSRSISQA